MKKIISVTAVLALLCVCSFAKNDPAPSLAISVPVEVVKSAIVTRMMSHGYHLESDTQFQMVWAKEMDNAKGAMAQLIAGNANCAMPKWIVNLTFAPQSDSVVVGTQQLDKATTLCARDRVELNGKKNREEMVSFLADIKSKAEALAQTKK
jgi:hypothetical protein